MHHDFNILPTTPIWGVTPREGLSPVWLWREVHIEVGRSVPRVYIRNGVTYLGCDLELVHNVMRRHYLGGGKLVSTTVSSVVVVYQVYIYVRCKMC